MVGWHHQCNGHKFEQILVDGEGERSLVCCNPWCHKESDVTEQLNNNRLLRYEDDTTLMAESKEELRAS